MRGPPLGPDGEDITWPDQVAPWRQKASSTRKIKPQTSNLTLPCHSYTHTLLGVDEEHVTGPSGLPVKGTREHSATKGLWPNRDATTRFPDRAWREGVLRLRAQRGC